MKAFSKQGIFDGLTLPFSLVFLPVLYNKGGQMGTINEA